MTTQQQINKAHIMTEDELYHLVTDGLEGELSLEELEIAGVVGYIMSHEKKMIGMAHLLGVEHEGVDPVRLACRIAVKKNN